MGSFSSKLLKNTCTEAEEEREKSKDTTHISDPRSPNDDIVRTPITFEEDKITPGVVSGVTNDENCKSPFLMKQRLLKNLKLDPRSPTEGISRTPIFLDGTYAFKSSQVRNFNESPLSIYSNNFSNSDSFSDVSTPQEPSVNVSGFENYKRKDLIADDIVTQGLNKTNRSENDEDKPLEKHNITKTPLKVSSKPSTVEARRILHEILSSKEFDHEFIFDSNKQSKSVKQKCLSIHCDNPDFEIVDKEKSKLKHRPPLSNITMASNSPSNVNSMKKPYGRYKILSDVGSENLVSPKIRQIAEWDKDKTVII